MDKTRFALAELDRLMAEARAAGECGVCGAKPAGATVWLLDRHD